MVEHRELFYSKAEMHLRTYKLSLSYSNKKMNDTWLYTNTCVTQLTSNNCNITLKRLDESIIPFET